MPDTAIPQLDPLAGADVADTDSLAIADISAEVTKELPFTDLLIALQARGAVKFVINEPADATIGNGECYLYLDTTVSPQTLNIKVKDTNSPGVIFSSVL